MKITNLNLDLQRKILPFLSYNDIESYTSATGIRFPENRDKIWNRLLDRDFKTQRRYMPQSSHPKKVYMALSKTNVAIRRNVRHETCYERALSLLSRFYHNIF